MKGRRNVCFVLRTMEEDPSSVGPPNNDYEDGVRTTLPCSTMHSGYRMAQDRTSLGHICGRCHLPYPSSSTSTSSGDRGYTTFIDNPVALTEHFENSDCDKDKWSA